MAVNRLSLWIAALTISVLPGDAEAQAQAISNDVIISLARANVGDEAILALIAQEACGYDISVERIRWGGCRPPSTASRCARIVVFTATEWKGRQP